jgi:hypothetical protein
VTAQLSRQRKDKSIDDRTTGGGTAGMNSRCHDMDDWQMLSELQEEVFPSAGPEAAVD